MISIQKKIERTHAFKNALSCMQFDFSLNPYLGFWYAEDRLYVVIDCMVDAIYLQVADSARDAIERILRRIEEAEHAGEYVEENYE